MQSVFNPTETPTPTLADPRTTLAAGGLATTGPTRIVREGVHRPASDEPTPEDYEQLTPERISEGWWWEHGRPHRPLELARDREGRWVVRGRADVVEQLSARGVKTIRVWVHARQRHEDRDALRYGRAFDVAGGHRAAYVYVEALARGPRGRGPARPAPAERTAQPCAQCGVGRRLLILEPDRHGVEGGICQTCWEQYWHEEMRDYTDLRLPADRAA